MSTDRTRKGTNLITPAEEYTPILTALRRFLDTHVYYIDVSQAYHKAITFATNGSGDQRARERMEQTLEGTNISKYWALAQLDLHTKRLELFAAINTYASFLLENQISAAPYESEEELQAWIDTFSDAPDHEQSTDKGGPDTLKPPFSDLE